MHCALYVVNLAGEAVGGCRCTAPPSQFSQDRHRDLDADWLKTLSLCAGISIHIVLLAMSETIARKGSVSAADLEVANGKGGWGIWRKAPQGYQQLAAFGHS